jgi:hypothetical protein
MIILFTHSLKSSLKEERPRGKVDVQSPSFNFITQPKRIIMNCYLKPMLTALTLALALTACDSKKENLREKTLENKADAKENKADVVRDKGEATADRIEKQDPGLNSDSTQRAAETARDTSEARADKLENEADRIREKK